MIVFEKKKRIVASKGDAVAEIKTMSTATAILVGLAQAIAVIPGVSRSAATIIAGLSRGLSREAIVLFTFSARRTHTPRRNTLRSLQNSTTFGERRIFTARRRISHRACIRIRFGRLHDSISKTSRIRAVWMVSNRHWNCVRIASCVVVLGTSESRQIPKHSTAFVQDRTGRDFAQEKRQRLKQMRVIH
jgi:hypothetical protein